MKESEEDTRCALCMRDGKYANISNLNYQEKTADELFLYCSGLKIRNDYFLICDGCFSDLIECYEFVKKCRKLPSKYIENYEHVEENAFGKDATNQGMKQAETFQICVINKKAFSTIDGGTKLMETNQEECKKEIKIEVDDETDAKFNGLVMCNKDVSLILNKKDHDYQEDSAKIDTEIKIEDTEIVKIQPDSDLITDDDLEINDEDLASRKTSYNCDACGKLFMKKQNLNRHVRKVHANKPMISCPKCGKFFKSAYLSEHFKKVHSNMKTFKCETCEKSFNQRYNLLSHIQLTHLNKEVCKCLQCNRCFKRKRALDRHMKTVHLDKKHFVCTTCGIGFTQKCSLKKHMSTQSHQRQKIIYEKKCEKTTK